MGDGSCGQRLSTGVTYSDRNDTEDNVPYLVYYEQMFAVALMEQPVWRV